MANRLGVTETYCMNITLYVSDSIQNYENKFILITRSKCPIISKDWFLSYLMVWSLCEKSDFVTISFTVD